MKISRRRVDKRRLVRSISSLFRPRYFFCEKTSGVAYFHVEAGKDGRFPLDEAVGLLAMHCMICGQLPHDYIVFLPVEEHQLKDLYEKTARLLQAGRSLRRQIRLTGREVEVLNHLTSNLTNTEIATSLNISERTVKFHVSSLLTKFNVRSRLDLTCEAWRYAPADSSMFGPIASQMAQPSAETNANPGKGLRPEGSVPPAKEQMLA